MQMYFTVKNKTSAAMLLFIILLVLSPGMNADPPENDVSRVLAGTWEGRIDFGAQKLKTVFRFKKTAAGFAASLDSPDQGAYGIPAADVEIEGKDITLRIPAVGAVYRARIDTADKRMDGAWKQRGYELPLTITKTTETAGRPQDPVPPFTYTTINVSFTNDTAGVTLSGTLVYPTGGGEFPAVVLVSGSGPQNRDAELYNHRPFAVIADYLARRGIAVIRYDDRGFGQSTGDFENATTDDFADDAEAAVNCLKNQRFFKAGAVGILGHSEGGLIAPLVAGRNGQVGFIILLAGPAVPGKDISLEQNKALARASGASEIALRIAYELNSRIFDIALSEMDPDVRRKRISQALAAAGFSGAALDAQLQVLTSPWYRHFLAYDPAVSLRRLRIPALALYGTLDLQVTAAQNAGAMRELLKNDPAAKVIVYPGLNHLFQKAATGLPAEYGTIDETISPAVLKDVSDFILGVH